MSQLHNSAINTTDFAEKLSSELDKILVDNSKTAFMLGNNFGIKFVGAKDVKIPTMTLIGLGDYDVDEGYPAGKITLKHKTYTVAKDRGRQFGIDAVEADDTGVEGLAANVLSEFVRTKVVPEMDAYVISKLYGIAKDKNQIVTLDGYTVEQKPYKALRELVTKVSIAGYEGEKVCFVPYDVLNSFALSEEINKIMKVSELKNGEIKTTVTRIDDVSLIGVNPNLMKTIYTFATGEDKSTGGITPHEDAQDIKMLMMPKSAASLIKKHETIKTFVPGSFPGKDAYEFDYRIHYDVFAKGSMEPTIFAL